MARPKLARSSYRESAWQVHVDKMTNLDLTPLEAQALEWLLRGEEPVLAALRKQLSAARILSRSMTGYGFYLDFEVPPDAGGLLNGSLIKGSFNLGDVVARVDSLERDVGFVLFVTHGKLDVLEGHTYDEKWPAHITKFEFRYLGGVGEGRDLQRLRRQWELPAG